MKNVGKQSGEPKDAATFGYVLWQIIGGKEANKGRAAQHLGIAASSLSNIIHGKKRISQQALIKKQWRRILAKHYPENWQYHSANFEQYASNLPSKANLSLEPTDKTTFGYILWLILGGHSAQLTNAARRLKVNRSSLTDIIHGRRKISQKALTKKKWEETLATHYPDNWKLHSSVFHSLVTKLSKSTGVLTGEPTDKNKFAHVLWLILGGVNADIDKAARCLKIDKPSLSAIFRGQRQISRKTLADKQWRKVLTMRYPEGWKQYSKAFDQSISTQPTRAGVSTREPKDTEGFGHILWLILGGKETEIVESAPRLNVSAKQLTAIIHGRRKIYKEILSDNYWLEILATHYPNTWQKFSATFEQRVTALPSKSEVRA